MNTAERYILKKTAGKDVGESIAEIRERLSAQAPGRTNRRADAGSGNNAVTAKLGRYRCMRVRKNRLDVKIRERLAFLKRAELEEGVKPSWFSYGREKNELLGMIKESAELAGKIKKCEELLDELDGVLKNAVFYRYFDMSERSMPSWKKTAERVGSEGPESELRAAVTGVFKDVKKS